MTDKELPVGNVTFGPPTGWSGVISIQPRADTMRAAIERAVRLLDDCHKEYENGTGELECIWCETQWPCAHAKIADDLRKAAGG